MDAEREKYDSLCCYTLEHGHPSFIHQHVVDAFMAQRADEHSKPIGVAFALAGLYLHVDRGLTGRQVQLAHMTMARQRRTWPRFSLPTERGAVTVADVMARPAGAERDAAIDEWCASVWNAWRDSRQGVVDLLREHGLES